MMRRYISVSKFIAILLVIVQPDRLSGDVRSRRFPPLGLDGGVNPPPYAHRAPQGALFFKCAYPASGMCDPRKGPFSRLVLQPSRYVFFCRRELHAGGKRHGLHQRREILVEISLRIGLQGRVAEMSLQNLARSRR